MYSWSGPRPGPHVLEEDRGEHGTVVLLPEHARVVVAEGGRVVELRVQVGVQGLLLRVLAGGFGGVEDGLLHALEGCSSISFFCFCA